MSARSRASWSTRTAGPDDELQRPGRRSYGPRKDVRRDPRRGRHRPRGPARLGVRRPRPQRRRQDDHDPHARDAAAARRRVARACSATTSSPTPTRCGRAISLTGQFASVDEELTGRENLVLLGRLLGYRGPGREGARRRAARRVRSRRRRPTVWSKHVLRRHAAPAGHRRQPRRRRPTLLFLDEPTTGLDPRSRNQVWDIVRALRRRAAPRSCSTTQYLDEADQLADRIAVIDHGKRDRRGHAAGSSRRRSAVARCTCGCRPRASCAAAERSLPRRARARGLEADPAGADRDSAPDGRPPPRRWPRWPRCGRSRWPTSRSASRAWTRCSSP